MRCSSPAMTTLRWTRQARSLPGKVSRSRPCAPPRASICRGSPCCGMIAMTDRCLPACRRACNDFGRQRWSMRRWFGNLTPPRAAAGCHPNIRTLSAPIRRARATPQRQRKERWARRPRRSDEGQATPQRQNQDERARRTVVAQPSPGFAPRLRLRLLCAPFSTGWIQPLVACLDHWLLCAISFPARDSGSSVAAS